jgi:hypothetical protein
VDSPFVGSEALAIGAMSRHTLRTRYRRVFPDVYAPDGEELTLAQRTRGAWLWSQRQGVIAGLAAAAMHGAKWVAPRTPVELVYGNPRPPRGVTIRRDSLLDDELQRCGAMAVTTPVRTAFDVGRRFPVEEAVARLDALAHATAFAVDDVASLATRHPGARGLRRLDSVLPLVDGGAQSPKETWLRLLLIRNGLPPPRTQLPVLTDDGFPLAFLDLGWDEPRVAVEYDGDHHRSDRRQYRKDIHRNELLDRMGWLVVRVVAEDHPVDIVRRVHRALDRRRSTVA